MDNKKEIRKRILGIRRSLSNENVIMRSKVVCENIKKTEAYDQCKNMCLYMPINNEVDVTLLVEAARLAGKEIYLPKTEDSQMEFYKYDEDTELVVAGFNILEPMSEEILRPDAKTLIVMPGSVFDRQKNRIGYGGGFYDRYLAQHPSVMTAAVCFDFQIVDELPVEAHDIKPDMIIAESVCY